MDIESKKDETRNKGEITMIVQQKLHFYAADDLPLAAVGFAGSDSCFKEKRGQMTNTNH